MRRTNLGMLAVALLSLSSTACVDEVGETQLNLCPDRAVFSKYVSPMMERRCGTLDCHGHEQRPLRLFGELGLRVLDENDLNRTGADATTELELDANYRSVCGIEPEKVSEVTADPAGQAVTQLLLVRKMRGQEGHKGGKVFDIFDDGDTCIVSWLRSDPPKVVRAACQRMLDRLPDKVDLPD